VTYGPNVTAAAILLGSAGDVPVERTATGDGGSVGVPVRTRNAGYTIRHAVYELRKLCGKELIVTPGRSRRYYVPSQAARTIATLLALRDHVIAAILAGGRSHP
jgi:hypothetical protein